MGCVELTTPPSPPPPLQGQREREGCVYIPLLCLGWIRLSAAAVPEFRGQRVDDRGGGGWIGGRGWGAASLGRPPQREKYFLNA